MNLHSTYNYMSIKAAFPFAQSFKSKQRTFLTLKKVGNNLGSTFYSRLIMIYSNTIEAIVMNKHDYIKKGFNAQLAEEIHSRKKNLKQNGYRLKLHVPNKPLLVLKNYVMPERTFRNQNFYVSANCKVYFGGQLDTQGPYAWQPYETPIRIGKFRYLVYNKRLSFAQNILNMYNNQFYEFAIKYESSRYIEVLNMQNVDAYGRHVESKFDEDLQQDCLTTEIVMRSSSHKFDWVIWDINNIMKQKSKR